MIAPKPRIVKFAGVETFAFQPNPILECPSCGRRFRVTPTRIYNRDCEVICSKCGYHNVGREFEAIQK